MFLGALCVLLSSEVGAVACDSVCNYQLAQLSSAASGIDAFNYSLQENAIEDVANIGASSRYEEVKIQALKLLSPAASDWNVSLSELAMNRIEWVSNTSGDPRVQMEGIEALRKSVDSGVMFGNWHHAISAVDDIAVQSSSLDVKRAGLTALKDASGSSSNQKSYDATSASNDIQNSASAQ